MSTDLPQAPSPPPPPVVPGVAAGTSLLLRRATTADAAAFAHLMGDDAVYPGLMQLPFPSEEQSAARLTENNTAARADHLHLVAERDGVVVGSAGLHPMPQLRRRHAALLGISVAREAQGQGVGSALMRALCSYADQWGQVLRIELTVFSDNTRAIALYRRHGFGQEGVLRGYALRQGVYEDVLSMARWHPSPPTRR